jgi:hypothetical protein
VLSSGKARMQQSDRFSLGKPPLVSPFREYRRALLLDGKPTGTTVWGDALSAAYSVGDRFLVISNYDYFDATTHYFYLLGSNLRPLDVASTPDYWGFFQDAKAEVPDRITFGFFGTNDRWSLVVSEHGFYSYRSSELRRRINRFFFCKRYMTFACNKGPPWSLQ